MLKKKKKKVYFRLGLKAQQGQIISAFVMPREENGGRYWEEWYQSYDGWKTNQLALVVSTSTGQDKVFEIDNSLEYGYFGPFDLNTGQTSGEVRRSLFDDDTWSGLNFLVYVNEKKEIVYRYLDGITSGSSQRIGEEVTFYPGPITAWWTEEIFASLTVTTFNEISDSSASVFIKEKKWSLKGEEIGESRITNTKTFARRGERFVSEYRYGRENGEDEVTSDYNIGTTSGTQLRFGISPMGSIFFWYQRWNLINDGSGNTELKTERLEIIDTDGENSQQTPNSSLKIFSQKNDYTSGSMYHSNWDDYDVWPVALKGNDGDKYILLPEDGLAFILKDGVKYDLEPGTFEINGTKYEIGNFYPQFFSVSNMMQSIWIKRPNWKRYDFDGPYLHGFFRDIQYMNFSWFGDYIYRIRVDEIIEEPLFTEKMEYAVRQLYKDNPIRLQEELEYLWWYQSIAEGLGFKPGVFLFDCLNNISTDKGLTDLSRFIELGGGINSLLKIYETDTNKLWVEKFKVEYGDRTAKITFVERFLNPFHSPLRTGLASTGDWDLDTLDSSLSRLKSICFVPYN